jgi:hypothetical protein
MLRRWGIVALVLLLPAASRGQEAPEQLLSAGTQVYLRWDGIDPHRAAYEKIALGQMLQGDTGKFVTDTFAQLQDLLGGAVVQELLQGTAPEKLQKLQTDAGIAPQLLPLLGKHGLIFAAEVKGVEPPDAQVTLIFPEMGANPKPLLATLRLVTTLAHLEVKQEMIEGRDVFRITTLPLPVACWAEGKHLILTAGTNLPDRVIKQLAKGPRLPESPLFQKVREFKQFETGARGFIDLAGIAKVAGSNQIAGKLIADLGVDGLKSMSFFSGFDGATERGVMELELSDTRKGVLRLLGGKPFTLAEVPPLPSDCLTWTMTQFDFQLAYDEALRVGETIAQLGSPDQAAKFKAVVKQLDEILGINVRKDVIESLGDQLVQYASAAEGPLVFGQTYLLKVKDAKKLQEALDQAIKAAGKAAGVDVTVKKRTFHGVEMREVHVRQQGFLFVPSYTIYKDWLAVSYFPQAVQGYILRATGELPTWKPEESTREAFAKLPKQFTTIAVSDPRPSVRQVLALAPFVGGAVNSFVPDSKLDVGLIPNGHEASRHLFPNVSVVSMDKNVLRYETRASLALPFDLGNSDALLAFSILPGLLFGAK